MMVTIKKIFSSYFPAILISLLFVTPFMVSKKLYDGVNVAKEFWFFAVITLMLLYWGIVMLAKKGISKISINIMDILLLIFYGWCFIRACFTPFISLLDNHKLQLLSGMIVLYFFIKLAILNERTIVRSNSNIKSFIIISLLLSGLFQAIWGLLQLYGVLPSLNSGFKITGSFINPAPYAMFLSVIFSFALGIYLFIGTNTIYSKIQKYLSLGTIILIIIILPVTYIRAAWVGCFIGSLVVLNFKYNLKGEINRIVNTKGRKALAIILLVIFSLTTSYFLFVLKKDSAYGRLLVWKVTTQMIKQRPVFGIGYSRFEVEYNNWQANLFASGNGTNQEGMLAGNIKFAYNEFFEMAAEIGIIGALLFLFLLIFPLVKMKQAISGINSRKLVTYKNFITSKDNIATNIKRTIETRQADSMYNGDKYAKISEQYIVISVFGGLVSLLVCAMFSYPFYILPIFTLLFILLSFLSSQISNIMSYRFSISRSAKHLLAITLFTIVFLFFNHQSSVYKSYKTWLNAVIIYNTQNYKLATKIYETAYTELKNNGLFLLHYGKCCEMNLDFEKSREVLENARNQYSDPVIYLTLGNCYNVMGQFERAEQSYLFASNMEPNKLYPKYLLAKMYDDTYQIDKAIDMANKILVLPVKVQSTAIMEIRKEMNKILEKNK